MNNQFKDLYSDNECEFCNTIFSAEDGDTVERPHIEKYRNSDNWYKRYKFGIVFDNQIIVYDIKYCPICGEKLIRR